MIIYSFTIIRSSSGGHQFPVSHQEVNSSKENKLLDSNNKRLQGYCDPLTTQNSIGNETAIKDIKLCLISTDQGGMRYNPSIPLGLTTTT